MPTEPLAASRDRGVDGTAAGIVTQSTRVAGVLGGQPNSLAGAHWVLQGRVSESARA